MPAAAVVILDSLTKGVDEAPIRSIFHTHFYMVAYPVEVLPSRKLARCPKPAARARKAVMYIFLHCCISPVTAFSTGEPVMYSGSQGIEIQTWLVEEEADAIS